jgi:lariat debranching enzyme
MLTIVIGGNHEASHHMRELNFGGWLAPNLYYLGAAGAVNLKPNFAKLEKEIGKLPEGTEANSIMRILGISGIFKPYSFFQDHPLLPFNKDTKRSCYHVRQLEILRSLMLKSGAKERKFDICIGHDWPRGAHKYGNYQKLIKVKPFFEKDIRSGRFGNPASTLVLNTLKP